MSSEASVSTSSSSRIRQFGLYRTIDARTEEFLRLSRKRQIKQGCACAAISTAITVTVVITVFFVYMEYGMNTDANQQPLGKAGWIGLINDTLASSFEEKFSKSKINFDRATIKLLPILIKALKQNRYLEKIIEDYSSSSPGYDGKVTTEFSFKKDIFLNARMKKPTSKLYTIEYKTSPIVFFKKPTKDPGYFTKNRKIRDYKRIMEYVEKMISEKVGLGSTVPMTNKKLEAHTEKLPKESQLTTNIATKVKSNKRYKASKKTPTKNKVSKPLQDESISCKCPKQLSILLDKIFNSIQQMMPDDKISKPIPCNGDQKTDTLKPRPDTDFYPPKTKVGTTPSNTLPSNTKASVTTIKQFIPVQFSEFDNIYGKEKTTVLPVEKTTQPIRLKYLSNLKLFETNKVGNTNAVNEEDSTIPLDYFTTKSSRLPFLESKNIFKNSELKTLSSFWGSREMDLDISQTTTAFDHIDPTDFHYDTSITTPPMPSTIDIMKREPNQNNTKTTESILIPTRKESSTTESAILESNGKNIHSDRPSQNSNFNSDTLSLNNIMQLNIKKNDHNMTTTTTTDNVIDKMNKFNIRSFELLKSKLLPTKRFNSTFKFPISTVQEYVTTSTTSENSITESTTTTIESPVATTDTHFYSYISKAISSDASNKVKLNNTSKPNIEYKLITSPIKMKENATINDTYYDKHKVEPFYLGLDNTALEDEIEKMTREDEYQEEYTVKPTESVTQPTIKNLTNKLPDIPGTDLWKILKNNERFFNQNSMIPHNRPTYLEIHRNDWKHDENKDYDTDMKYNIFDLL